MHWMAVLAGPRPVDDPAMQHQHEGTGAGMRAAPTAFASQAVAASDAPPAPADVMGGPLEAPTASTLIWTAMVDVQAQGACGGFEVCLFAYLLMFAQS